MKKKVWHLLFFFGIFLVFFLPPIDTDLGWHLRYGEYFWQTGKFLTTNNLTVLLENYQWPHSYSFYQILTFLIFNLTGFWGLSFFYGTILVLTFYFLYLCLEKNIYAAVISFIITACLSKHVFNLGLRAQAFSFLGLTLLFYILKSQRRLFLLPLIFLLWVNLHGGFILGIIVYFIFLLLQLISSKGRSASGGKSILYFISSIFATLLNPYKTKVWWEAWHHLQIPMKNLISEWVSPPPTISFLIIIGFYIFIVVLLKISNPSDETSFKEIDIAETYRSSFFFKLFGLFLIVTIIFCLIPTIGIIFTIIMFLGIFLLAPLFFIIFIIKALRK